MKNLQFKTFFAAAIFSLFVIAGSAISTSAQGNSQWAHEKNRIRKQQKQYEKAQRQAYRVYRNGSYYQTDSRGAELLRQAVNQGYNQGYQQGRRDAQYNRGGNYYGNNMYRSGTYGYQSYVDRNQYQYYFQQGFQRGYEDGFNNQNRYGYRTNSGFNILGNILNGIL